MAGDLLMGKMAYIIFSLIIYHFLGGSFAIFLFRYGLTAFQVRIREDSFVNIVVCRRRHAFFYGTFRLGFGDYVPSI